jgi:hypothetical protein
MTDRVKRWSQRIQWTDIVLVVIVVAVLLLLTMEIWLPHIGPD